MSNKPLLEMRTTEYNDVTWHELLSRVDKMWRDSIAGEDPARTHLDKYLPGRDKVALGIPVHDSEKAALRVMNSCLLAEVRILRGKVGELIVDKVTLQDKMDHYRDLARDSIDRFRESRTENYALREENRCLKGKKAAEQDHEELDKLHADSDLRQVEH